MLKNKDLEEPYYINSYCENIEDPMNKYDVKITIENIIDDSGTPACILKNKDLEGPFFISDTCGYNKVFIIDTRCLN
ncbi:hypothetical protein [Photobacterium damselae]|uniref:hypothetical protein n=1 Tax=Photobacterium damselae TaxID=38293 RepID=UPI000D04A2FD|nr:hypothetical protein [Photobacterium damselae]PSB80584.1 hypothetical protein C5F62_14585 [Photobacterium damselae subsp. damselae]